MWLDWTTRSACSRSSARSRAFRMAIEAWSESSVRRSRSSGEKADSCRRLSTYSTPSTRAPRPAGTRSGRHRTERRRRSSTLAMPSKRPSRPASTDISGCIVSATRRAMPIDRREAGTGMSSWSKLRATRTFMPERSVGAGASRPSPEGSRRGALSPSNRKPRSAPTRAMALSTITRSRRERSVSVSSARVTLANTRRFSRSRRASPESVCWPTSPEACAAALRQLASTCVSRASMRCVSPLSGGSLVGDPSPTPSSSIDMTARPIRSWSPAASTRRSMRSSLTRVPLEEPRSTAHSPPAALSMRQWWRLTW